MQSEKTNLPGEAKLPAPAFNLMDLTFLRKHFHKLGNQADRDLALASSEKVKKLHRGDRDYFKSIANYLDIADHIKMSEL